MKKSWLIGMVAVLVLSVGSAVLWHLGRPAYHRFKDRRFTAQAREFAAQGDLRSAWLSARTALQVNPTNTVATHILADIAAAARWPTEVDWRRRLVEIEPSLTNRLALVESLLRQSGAGWTNATAVLEEIPAADRQVPSYQVLSAELALKLNDVAAAEEHFREAARLDPSNGTYRLNLAVLGLRSSDAARATEARASLAQLGSRTNLGRVALNWLVNDSLRRSNLVEVLDFSKRLAALPDATMPDRLLRLDMLLQAGDVTLTNEIVALQKRVSTNAADIFGLSGWMVDHRMADRALAWLQGLPARMQPQQPVPVAIVDCLMARQEWQAVQEFLNGPAWGEMEYLRQAFLSESSRRINQTVTAAAQWRNAIQQASDRLSALTTLLNLTRQWRRAPDQADLLWAISDRYPQEHWALRELEALYTRTANTRGLNKVYAAELSFDPNNDVLRNNLAATGLLLDHDPTEAGNVAKALHDAHPDDPALASTYAFALLKQGRAADGLALISKLNPDQLKLPSVAAYYALLLAANGQNRQARTYAAIARGTFLLPEEKTLLDKLEGGASE